MLTRLEDLTARRTGEPVAAIRQVVARGIRTGTGTLANVRKRRRKNIPAWLMEAIRRELIEELEHQMRAHEHEIAILKQTGADTDAVIAAASSQAATRALLKAAVRG